MNASKITKITIGRLFNLGSYEHIRYELTVEVGERQSAGQACQALEVLTESLNPKRPGCVSSIEEIRREEASLARAELMPLDQFRREVGEPAGGRDAYLERCRASIAQKKDRLEKWNAHRNRARQLFDDLGGISHYRDAKQDWDNWDDVDF
jgi:hypothetical protein